MSAGQAPFLLRKRGHDASVVKPIKKQKYRCETEVGSEQEEDATEVKGPS